MNITDQVCSLELAKRLKELGVKQESIFVWEYYDDKCYAVKFISYAVMPDNYNKAQLYSAFTVAELGEIFPSYFEKITNDKFKIFNFIQWKIGNKYMINYYSSYPISLANENTNADLHVRYHISNEHFIELKEADARAKMLIYLIENGLIEDKPIFIPENAASLILGDKK